MRLSDHQRQLLKDHVVKVLGSDCELWLFGSRTDDTARGGDVDLLVRCHHPLERKLLLAARLAARAERLLDGRKVDLILMDPATPTAPIHDAALAHGVRL